MANRGRRWFEQRKNFVARSREPANDTPDLWTRCPGPGCAEAVYNETLAEHQMVCPHCDYHFRIGGLARIHLLADGEFQIHDSGLSPVDALKFVDSKPYSERLALTREKTSLTDAYVAATIELDEIPVELGCFEFSFMGGSMGSVVGEAITRQLERALAARNPAIIISASGGARMQEGVLSLMQMAKTSAALGRLRDAGIPYISILTHPTTGGVAASFAMLGDVILAEPCALIGFAGPRVIKQTIGQDLPEGFQTSEYLLSHGMIDQIVGRNQLKLILSRLLRQFLGLPPRSPVEIPPPAEVAPSEERAQ